MLSTPVVLISFNRPDLTGRALERIRAAAPTQLFLLADGPRPDHPEDAAKCAAVREALEAVDWPCEVHRRYNDGNRGCEATVELGLDWVFEQVSEAIILEDDCLPGPSFFDFCSEMLARFHDDPRVAHISGTTLFVPSQLFSELSYAFGSFAGVWGWATWRRAWQEHRAQFPRSHAGGTGVDGSGAERPLSPTLDGGRLVTGAGVRYFREVAHSRSERGFGWDSHWYLSTVSSGRLAVTPAVNLVENVGFSADATHTQSTRKMPGAGELGWPLRHPAEVKLNADVERELELVLVRANGRLARTVRRAVPQGPLRAIARTLVTGRATARVMHLGSRLSSAVRGSKQPAGRFHGERDVRP